MKALTTHSVDRADILEKPLIPMMSNTPEDIQTLLVLGGDLYPNPDRNV